MKTKYTIETTMKIYEEDEGHFIELAPSADFPGNLILSTKNKNEEYFGIVCLDLPIDFWKSAVKAISDLIVIEEARLAQDSK